MDNLCHSLAGAAIAQTGFARHLPRATVLGIIAANIPDVDAFLYFGADSATAVSFRRGWTHGLPALVAWSLLLASLFAWLSRRWPQAPAAPAQTEPRTFRARDFAALAAIAVCSHPLLDWMNTYGVRFFKPFSDQWFYGDTLFIVDPVLLTLFGAGWVVSSRMLARRNARSEWAARVALGVAILYIVAMKSLSVVTRKAASLEYGLEAPSARDLMVVPRPLAWLARDVVVKSGDSYDRYSWDWEVLRPVQVDNQSSTPTGADSATVALVRSTRDGRNFLVWSRFPYFARDSASNSIFVGDLRYSSGTEESWAGIRVHPGATTNPAAR